MKISLLLIAALLLLSGCSVTGPQMREQSDGPARVLLAQAQLAAQAGELNRAIALVERAVRIEPRNPYLWHRLAQLQLRAGNRTKAAQFARRSEQFGDQDPQLRRANRHIIETAREH